ncbi:hypothetical protein C8R46DRAFT_1023636 [Mycena filopes]|nr:hypothetical protein C8R46DRAFT_1023636 [Mycena filopes]
MPKPKDVIENLKQRLKAATEENQRLTEALSKANGDLRECQILAAKKASFLLYVAFMHFALRANHDPLAARGYRNARERGILQFPSFSLGMTDQPKKLEYLKATRTAHLSPDLEGGTAPVGAMTEGAIDNPSSTMADPHSIESHSFESGPVHQFNGISFPSFQSLAQQNHDRGESQSSTDQSVSSTPHDYGHYLDRLRYESPPPTGEYEADETQTVWGQQLMNLKRDPMSHNPPGRLGTPPTDGGDVTSFEEGEVQNLLLRESMQDDVVLVDSVLAGTRQTNPTIVPLDMNVLSSQLQVDDAVSSSETLIPPVSHVPAVFNPAGTSFSHGNFGFRMPLSTEAVSTAMPTQASIFKTLMNVEIRKPPPRLRLRRDQRRGT